MASVFCTTSRAMALHTTRRFVAVGTVGARAMLVGLFSDLEPLFRLIAETAGVVYARGAK